MDDIPFFDTSSLKRAVVYSQTLSKQLPPLNSEFSLSDPSDTDSAKVLNDGLSAASLSDSDGSGSLGQAETTSQRK